MHYGLCKNGPVKDSRRFVSNLGEITLSDMRSSRSV